MYRSCNCNWMNNNDECQNSVYETKCMNVQNQYDNYLNDCMCGFNEESLFPENPIFGQSYVPWQRMNKTFVPRTGLKMGTIFPELVSPYCPGQSMEEIKYIEESNRIGKGCNG